jgi:hypothetical protein
MHACGHNTLGVARGEAGSQMWLDFRSGGTWSGTKNWHFSLSLWSRQWEEHNTVWIKSLSQLVMELLLIEDVHFVWTMKTLQACISIQYYAQSAPFCRILSQIILHWIVFSRYYIREKQDIRRLPAQLNVAVYWSRKWHVYRLSTHQPRSSKYG